MSLITLLATCFLSLVFSWLFGIMMGHWTNVKKAYPKPIDEFQFPHNWEKFIGLPYFRKVVLALGLSYLEFQLTFGKRKKSLNIEEIKQRHFIREFEYLYGAVFFLGLTIIPLALGNIYLVIAYLLTNLLGNVYPLLLHHSVRHKLSLRKLKVR